MKLIPAGEFLMGSAADEGFREDEVPQHRVQITKAFYMGATEVTQGQWLALMGQPPERDRPYVFEGDDYPTEYVSWEDAVEFCKKLSIKEGQTYRLPTEAEWEYACRGGTNAAYSFGGNVTNLSDYAWWQGNSSNGKAKTETNRHQVGTRKANPFGLYDMHGNVWEWCADSYNYNENVYRTRRGISADPVSMSGSGMRVLRGGSSSNDSNSLRSAGRRSKHRAIQGPGVGFRVVR